MKWQKLANFGKREPQPINFLKNDISYGIKRKIVTFYPKRVDLLTSLLLVSYDSMKLSLTNLPMVDWWSSAGKMVIFLKLPQ